MAQAQVIKSAEDTRLYRAVTLPNGLVALLIHDPTTDKARLRAYGDCQFSHLSLRARLMKEGRNCPTTRELSPVLVLTLIFGQFRVLATTRVVLFDNHSCYC